MVFLHAAAHSRRRATCTPNDWTGYGKKQIDGMICTHSADTGLVTVATVSAIITRKVALRPARFFPALGRRGG